MLQMSAFETGQMSSVETGQMSAAETGQMSDADPTAASWAIHAGPRWDPTGPGGTPAAA